MDGFSAIKNSIARRRELLNSQFRFKTIDYKNKKRFYLPDELVEQYLPAIKKAYSGILAKNVAMILMVLARHSDKNGVSYPSYGMIMQRAGISNRNQLHKILKIMQEELKMFEYYAGRGKTPNVYKLSDVKFWTPVDSIVPKITVSNPPLLQYHNSDTQRNCIKELRYKERENNLKTENPEPLKAISQQYHNNDTKRLDIWV